MVVRLLDPMVDEIPLGRILGVLIHFAAGLFLAGELPDVWLLAMPLGAVPLILWLIVSPFVCVCIALAGDVMSREERNR